MANFIDAIASAVALAAGNRGGAAGPALDVANFLSLYGDGSGGNVRVAPGGVSPFDAYVQGAIIQSRVYQFNDLTIESDLDIPSGATILCKGNFRLSAKLHVKPALTPSMGDFGIAGSPAGISQGGNAAVIRSLDFRRILPVGGGPGATSGVAAAGTGGGAGGGSIMIRAGGKFELTDTGMITADGDDATGDGSGGGGGGVIAIMAGAGVISAAGGMIQARGGKGKDAIATVCGGGGGGGGVLYLIGPGLPAAGNTDVTPGVGGATFAGAAAAAAGGGGSGGFGGFGGLPAPGNPAGAAGKSGRVFMIKAKRPELLLIG